ncbi:META and DUF4377 domain-containing protein [Laribacter hongkongensis]|uniref:META and DUF4377 domain-containing protein n=1 Tax=Laribacter hongkongensis TaxID=168471 RepID=UPI0018789523|nr:META and DUF4377 domain-containing protein [Laribacter hongkongensis]MBE5527814.1 hypothetical protein [Laribacter hongkongensis]MCG8994729.1 META and DUF4377 domain-containing protein [Laribacter hongkongensis]MCG9009512.1 META and DUF4377 domain-containing protein [Laribacter hongkongensis]MCG9021587.1 META and DUF4377 domain-containing protein [Laribacter hongkongensis]MCG9045798.1 META and DUF4377 domain-containing protein [Laribacter hongkongensis]
MNRSHFLALCATASLAACASAPSSVEALQGKWVENRPAGNLEPIVLQLQDGQISASAGCNRLFGPARIENGHLVVERLASTMMMCEPQLMQREDSLKQLLQSRPAITLKEGELRLNEQSFSSRPVVTGGKIIFVYVAAERRPCSGVGKMDCLQVRTDKNRPWELHYGEIEGFKPEPGIAYRLRIREVPVAQPAADAPDRRWILDQIIESEVVNP